jgi:hypothetical protein
VTIFRHSVSYAVIIHYLKTRTSLIYGITVLSFLFTHFSAHVSSLRTADGVTALISHPIHNSAV